MASEISKQKATLWYCGGLGDNDGPQYVTCGGQAYVLPPPGESVVIELYKAEDLMRRYNVKGNSYFTLVKPGTPVAPAQAERKFTREELLLMLSTLPSEQETKVDFSGEPDAPEIESTAVVPKGKNKTKDKSPALPETPAE